MKYLLYACLLFTQVACGQVNKPKKQIDNIQKVAKKDIIQKIYTEKQLLEIGLKHAGVGAYQKAIEMFNRVLKINPEYLSAYIERADCYLEMSYFSKAIADLKLVLKKDADNSLAYNNLANVFFRKVITLLPLSIIAKAL